MTSPAEDIGKLLQNASIGTLGTDIYIGKMPDQDDAPDQALAVIDTGATYISPKWQRDEFLIQIIVRSAKMDYSGGYALAKSVQDAMQGISPQTLNGHSYVLFAMNGGINALGTDQRDRHAFSLNFRVVAENIPGGVRSSF